MKKSTVKSSKKKKNQSVSVAEKLYNQYAHLAEIYAKRISSYESLGFEKDDIVQDLRVKIYTCILSYGKAYSEYLATGKYKPVPIKIYITSGLLNLLRDKYEYLRRRKHEAQSFSFQQDQIDVGEHIEEKYNLSNKYELCGVDLCMGLSGTEKLIFQMYLKGHTPQSIRRNILRGDNWKVSMIKDVIERQKETLQPYKDRLMQLSVNTFIIKPSIQNQGY